MQVVKCQCIMVPANDIKTYEKSILWRKTKVYRSYYDIFAANSRCQQFQVSTLINLMVFLLAAAATVSLAKPSAKISVYNKPTRKVWHLGHGHYLGHYQGDGSDIYIEAPYINIVQKSIFISQSLYVYVPNLLQ